MMSLNLRACCRTFIMFRYCGSRTFSCSGLVSSATTDKTTHFGFETVGEEEKEEKVHQVFDSVATKYDLMNDVMSGGIHRLWKNYFVSLMRPRVGTRLLDVAGGTGDIAFRYLEYLDRTQKVSRMLGGPVTFDPSRGSNQNQAQKGSLVTVCDINEAMLEVGKEKAAARGVDRDITWLLGNAEALPMVDNEFDLYSIAFGIRNVTHIDRVLSEAFRVLKRRGRFYCLEFSRVDNIALRRFYDEYSFQVIPVMGKIIAGDWKSYQYLVESIRKFPPQEEFAEMIKEAGFQHVGHKNLFGGVAAIHYATKL